MWTLSTTRPEGEWLHKNRWWSFEENKHDTVEKAPAEYIFEEMELLLCDLILVVFALFNAKQP